MKAFEGIYTMPPMPTPPSYDPTDPVVSAAATTGILQGELGDAQNALVDFNVLKGKYLAALVGNNPNNSQDAQKLVTAYEALVNFADDLDFPTDYGTLDLLEKAQWINGAHLIPNFTVNGVDVGPVTLEGQIDAAGEGFEDAIEDAQEALDTWLEFAADVQEAWEALLAFPGFDGDPDGEDALDDIEDFQEALANATDILPSPLKGTIGVVFTNEHFWELTYTAPDFTVMDTNITLESTVEDGSLTFTGTTKETAPGGAQEIDFDVSFEYGFDADIDLTGAPSDRAFTINGSENANNITTGDGDDTVYMNGGANKVVLNGGNNVVREGDDDPTSGNRVIIEGGGMNNVSTGGGADRVKINGDGENTVATGAGDDKITVNGNKANTIWAGAGDDEIIIKGTGNNTVGSGEGNDKMVVSAGASGNNMLFGSPHDGNNIFVIDGGGDNTVFGGGGKGFSTITVNGNGDNMIMGGNSVGTSGNQISINGSGANVVFNGTGNDTVMVNNNANNVEDARKVILWGGQGDDEFIFGNNSAGTLKIVAGNGRNTIEADTLLDNKNIMVDLSALFDNEDDVLDRLTDDPVNDNAVLRISVTSETLTFIGYSVNDLTNSGDWLLV